MSEDIKKAYSDFENTFFDLQASVEARAETLFKENPAACQEYLTKYSNETAQRVVDDWWALADQLIAKYNDGYVRSPKGSRGAGYPEKWLEAVGYGKTKIKNN